MRKANRTLESLETIHPHAAGLDIGAQEIWACVPADRITQTLRDVYARPGSVSGLAGGLRGGQCSDDTAGESPFTPLEPAP